MLYRSHECMNRWCILSQFFQFLFHNVQNCVVNSAFTIVELNPLVPSVLYIGRLTQNFNLKSDPKKKFLWASRLWVCRPKEPILGYDTRNYEKKNSYNNMLYNLLDKRRISIELRLLLTLSIHAAKRSSFPV